MRYVAKIVKVNPVYGEAGNPIEAWVTLSIKNKEIETFNTGTPIVPPVGKELPVNIVLSAYELERVNVKKKLFRQITSYPWEGKSQWWPSIPMYLVVAPIKRIIEEDNKRVILDVGFDLEVHIVGHESERRLIKEGDWVFILGKMFGKVINEEYYKLQKQQEEAIKKESEKKVREESKKEREGGVLKKIRRLFS